MDEQAEYEITWCDDGQVGYFTEEECNDLFGTAEFLEIKQGHAPHVVAIQVL